MKKFNKVMALVLSVAVVLAMSVVPAFAASITLNENDTHEYKVFQVLTGTLAKEGDKQLGNPDWGADAIADPGDVNAFITEITATGLSEADIATKVAAKVDTTGNGRGTVKAGTPLTGLATGYYVLVDQTQLTGDHKLDTKSLHVVQVLNDNTLVNIKYGTTEDKKTIESDTLGTDNNTKDNNKLAEGSTNDNVSIGDTVNFNIAAKVPDNAKKFKKGTFFFVITDKLSDGLTFTQGSIKVYDGDVELSSDKYTVQYDINDNTFEIGLKNAADYEGKTINVKYSAVLNEKAKIGDEGNPNTSTVKFSNDPNKTYDGSPEDSAHPGFPDSTKNVPTGETPQSETKTYTTGIEIKKVDENKAVLTGAEFTITGNNVQVVLVSEEVFKEDTNGEYYKLNDGTYTKEQPVTEDKMEEAAAGATEGYVRDAEATGADAITVGGIVYRPYVPATDGGKTVYILVKSNSDQYQSIETKYTKTIEYKQKGAVQTPTDVTAAVDENGIVTFKGLGAGTYTISESKTPSGYNTISDFDVTISFNANPESGASHWTATSEYVKDDTDNPNGAVTYDDGIFKIQVENQKGQELPETGGIGTTIFYVLGAILVIGAGVLLVTRRRMNAN